MKNLIKYLILLLVLICISDVFPQESWEVYPSPTTKFLRKMFFLDSLNGWAVGDSGVIIHTSNGGDNWNIQYSNDQRYMTSVFFINKMKGFVLGWEQESNAGTRIFKTLNGGINWTDNFYPDSINYLNKIYFLDSLRGWIGGFPNSLAYTTDGGNSWIHSTRDSAFGSSFPVYNFISFGNGNGFATGGYFDVAGVIWKTTDYGVSWTSMITGPEPIYAIHMFNEQNFIAAGGDYEYGPSITRTNNAGENWQYSALNQFGIAQSIKFRTPTEGWIPLAYGNAFLKSTNSGNNWTLVPTPDSSSIYDLEFITSRKGWAVGERGVILKYTNITGINNTNFTIPDTPVLFQNYPNPFNPVTIIRYNLSFPGKVELKIFNILGREIQTIVNKYQNPGSYSIPFYSGILPSSIYYYRLSVYNTKNENEIHSETKKMIIAK